MTDTSPDATVVRASDTSSSATIRSSGERFTPGDVLAGRYRIVSLLGRGGMGEVYRAEDLRLGQDVALKFLPAALAASDDLFRRLVSEVRIGRQVSHPNVCRLYDLVEEEGQRFVSMEFIDGEDLATLLRRIGRFSVDKGIAVSHQILAGLGAAHDQGVVHRDLKPANVMLDGQGRARITDFGLAVAAGSGRGELAGTAAYMAPEQLRGEPATPRSDIYALGLVLFEIFSGRRVFEGVSLSDLENVHRETRPHLRAFVPEADPELETAILACLAPDPTARPRSVRDVAAMIPPLPGESAHSAGRGAARSSSRRSGSSGRQAQRASIAVLPFDSPGQDADHDFAVALAEEIIGDLGKIRALRVISRGSVMRFRGAQEARPVARELNVRYVLTGSVRKAGNQIRINATLVDGEDETLVWSDKFRGTLDDIFDIQETIARSIASQLEIRLTAEEEESLAERAIDDPAAYEVFLRVKGLIYRFEQSALERAEALLNDALVLYPDNVLLKATLALVCWQFFNSGTRPDPELLDRAEKIARELQADAPDASHAHRILGLVAVSRGRLRDGLEHLREALRADPNDSEALLWLPIIASYSGLGDLAGPVARRKVELDPLGTESVFAPGCIAWMAGDFDRAIEYCRLARDRQPENSMWLVMLWILLASAGREREAALVAELLPAGDDSFFGRLGRYLQAALAGRRDEALALLGLIETAAREDFQYPIIVAEGLAMLGERERALEWLEHGMGRGFLAWEYLARHDRFLVSLRDEPRFRALIERARRENEALRSELGTLSPFA